MRNVNNIKFRSRRSLYIPRACTHESVGDGVLRDVTLSGHVT